MTNKEHLASLQTHASDTAGAYQTELTKDADADPTLLLQLRRDWDDAEDLYMAFLSRIKSDEINLTDTFSG